MRKVLILFILSGMFFFQYAAGQSQDSLLARMAAIKLDPDYLYGSCTMPDLEESVVEATLDLNDRLAHYLKENGFVYIRGASACPPEVIQLITMRKDPNHYRTIAYISKSHLRELEQIEAAAFDHVSRNAILEFFRQLPEIETLSDIQELLPTSRTKAHIMSGPVTIETPQEYVDGGFLVYYEHSSDRIIEIMSPRDSLGVRTNIRSGSLTDPMKYRMVPAYWIFVDKTIMQMLQ